MSTSYDPYTDELDMEGLGEGDLHGRVPVKPGWYHVVVLQMDNSRAKIDGLWPEFQVLAGTTAGQTGKTIREIFNDPSPDHKDSGRFCKQRRATLAVALGIVPKSAVGTKPRINWEDGIGRQCIIKVDMKEDAKYPNIDGLNIFPVDDPEVSHVPKDAEALKAMGIDPAALSNGNGGAANGAANGIANPAPAAGPTATQPADAYGDLGI